MKGEIPDQQTQLAKELELDGIGKKLARELESIGVDGAVDREAVFESDKQKIFKSSRL